MTAAPVLVVGLVLVYGAMLVVPAAWWLGRRIVTLFARVIGR